MKRSIVVFAMLFALQTVLAQTPYIRAGMGISSLSDAKVTAILTVTGLDSVSDSTDIDLKSFPHLFGCAAFSSNCIFFGCTLQRTPAPYYQSKKEQKQMSHITSLINALSLIILGFIGYQAGGSATALIPVGFGVVLLILVPGVKKEQMVPAHLAVFLTFTVAFALLKPLSAALGRDDGAAVIRTSIMLATSVLALVCFIKSFRAVRRAREAAQETGSENE